MAMVVEDKLWYRARRFPAAAMDDRWLIEQRDAQQECRWEGLDWSLVVLRRRILRWQNRPDDVLIEWLIPSER